MGEDVVAAAIADHTTAPIREELRAALEFLTKFVPPEEDFGIEDIERMRAVGLTNQNIKDVMYASFSFQCLSKWADAFNFPIHTPRLKKIAAFFMWRASYTRASVGPD